MTNSHMGRRYIEEATGRLALVRLAVEKTLSATAVREAQECVELFLKGALRLVSIEPMRTHDVAELLRREARRFPEWFATQIDYLASISTEMAGDRGLAYYGDERQDLAPQDLFDGDDARRALENAEYVADLCRRLLEQERGPAEA